MSKQIVLVSLSAVMFIAVWVMVIFQFNAMKNEPLEFQEPLDLAVIDKEMVPDRAIPLPDSIASEKVSVTEKNSRETFEGGEASSLEDTAHENQGLVSESGALIDLRLYDFSDIATPDGIPIEGILSTLNLE